MGLFGPPDVKKMKARRDVDALMKALNYQSSWQIRGEAARALGELKDARAVEALIAVLKDENAGVRSKAAEALGEIGDTRAVKPLIARLKDKNVYMRVHAAGALGKIGDTRAVGPLSAALKEPVVRKASSDALTKIGWKPGKDEEGAAYWVAYQNWVECIGIGAPAVGPLATALKDENAGVRSKAAEALGAIGDAHAAEPLIDALRDNVNSVRKAATEALGKIGPSAMESLLPALQDKNSCVRRGAVEALGKIGDGRAVDPLIAVLNDEDKEVRERTIRVLGNIGAVQAVGPLIAGLQDRDPEVRRAAIEALVGLYKAGQLDEACKKLILTHSSEITSPHEDSYTCIGRHEGHTDIKSSALL